MWDCEKAINFSNSGVCVCVYGNCLYKRDLSWFLWGSLHWVWGWEGEVGVGPDDQTITLNSRDLGPTYGPFSLGFSFLCSPLITSLVIILFGGEDKLIRVFNLCSTFILLNFLGSRLYVPLFIEFVNM